jgi:hypothetical protein
MVVLTTCSKLIFASAKTAAIFFITWWVSASKLDCSNSPVSGTNATCPLKNTKPLALTAWLYGPMGEGAFSVLITCFGIIILLWRQIDAFP